MLIKFSAENQIIERLDKQRVVAKSRSYLFAHFDFKTDDWPGVKTALFDHPGLDKPIPAIIDSNNICLVPWEWLNVEEETNGEVSVFCSDRVTTNTAPVTIERSGYKKSAEPKPPTPDVYAQIIAMISGGEIAGKSAYQVWLDNGNAGTVADYLADIKGEQGDSAYKVWLSAGNTGTVADFLAYLQATVNATSLAPWVTILDEEIKREIIEMAEQAERG